MLQEIHTPTVKEITGVPIQLRNNIFVTTIGHQYSILCLFILLFLGQDWTFAKNKATYLASFLFFFDEFIPGLCTKDLQDRREGFAEEGIANKYFIVGFFSADTRKYGQERSPFTCLSLVSSEVNSLKLSEPPSLDLNKSSREFFMEHSRKSILTRKPSTHGTANLNEEIYFQ